MRPAVLGEGRVEKKLNSDKLPPHLFAEDKNTVMLAPFKCIMNTASKA